MPLSVLSLTEADDFRRLLQRRPVARHAGWTLHAQRCGEAELSTRVNPGRRPPVDESTLTGQDTSVATVRGSGAPIGDNVVQTGVVLSRRNVRRAATRNLMRRIWKNLLAESQAAGSGPGSGATGTLAGWQVVLRRQAVWSRDVFRSTQSAPLRRQLRADLSTLLEAWRRPRGGASSAAEARP